MLRAVTGLGLCLALGWIYGPLVVEDPLLGRDDLALVGPLQRMHGTSDYLDALRGGQLKDVQPVRDASFALDLWAGDRLGFTTFHLTNLLVWMVCAGFAWALLRALSENESVAAFGVALFALHPAFVGSVAWVAARKHLLAFAFLLPATLHVVRAARRPPGGGGFALRGGLYGLAVFSQPIALLWPAWACAVELGRGRRRAALATAVACAPFGAAAAVANVIYYTQVYPRQSGGEKFVEVSGTTAVALLSLGRSFLNLVFPRWLSTAYDPGAWPNLVGLLALPLGVAWSVRRWGFRSTWTWWLLFALPLGLVTARMTTVFCSDTYLLVPGLALACLVAQGLAGETTGRWGLGTVAAVAVGILGVESHALALTWRSDAALWAHAYQTEPTPNVLAKQAFFLSQQGRADEAVAVALRLGAWAPSHPEYGYVLSKAVVGNPKLTAAEKRDFLQAHAVRDPWVEYRLAWLEAQLGNWAQADRRMREALQAPGAFKAEIATVVAEAHFVCRRAQGEACDALVDAGRRSAAWDEALFQQRRTRLGE